MTDQKNEEHNVEGLLRKNAELLDEIKTLKGRIVTLEDERDAAQSARDSANAEVQRVMLDEPLKDSVASMFSVPWRIMRPIIEEHFKFALGDDGNPVLSDLEGNPVSLGERSAEFAPEDLRQVMMAVPDIAATMRPPQGGGARGNDGRVSIPPAKSEPEKVAPKLGLR